LPERLFPIRRPQGLEGAPLQGCQRLGRLISGKLRGRQAALVHHPKNIFNRLVDKYPNCGNLHTPPLKSGRQPGAVLRGNPTRAGRVKIEPEQVSARFNRGESLLERF
jgi:hypothetical protein